MKWVNCVFDLIDWFSFLVFHFLSFFGFVCLREREKEWRNSKNSVVREKQRGFGVFKKTTVSLSLSLCLTIFYFWFLWQLSVSLYIYLKMEWFGFWELDTIHTPLQTFVTVYTPQIWTFFFLQKGLGGMLGVVHNLTTKRYSKLIHL